MLNGVGISPIKTPSSETITSIVSFLPAVGIGGIGRVVRCGKGLRISGFGKQTCGGCNGARHSDTAAQEEMAIHIGRCLASTITIQWVKHRRYCSIGL